MGAQHGRQLPGQCCHDGAVGPAGLGPSDLTPEHRDLMTEHHDLGILGRLASAEQRQRAKDPDRDQVEQAKGHKPRSFRNRLIRPIRRSQYLRRVLKRYRVYTMGPLALCDIALASTRAADRPFLIRRGRAAERRQASPGHRRTSLPLAWLLAQGGEIVPISGTRRSERVEENVGADAIELGAGQLNRLNDVEPSVGDRYADMTPINR
jgi:hypothetical protein